MLMSESYDIEIKVISQKGSCHAGHKVGDKWTVSAHTPGGICLEAYKPMQSSIDVLKYGGAFTWQQDPDVSMAVCPDPVNPVVFELKRLRKK
jgi:uncharacterized repeat protein (TIGR04076 family)